MQITVGLSCNFGESLNDREATSSLTAVAQMFRGWERSIYHCMHCAEKTNGPLSRGSMTHRSRSSQSGERSLQ